MVSLLQLPSPSCLSAKAPPQISNPTSLSSETKLPGAWQYSFSGQNSSLKLSRPILWVQAPFQTTDNSPASAWQHLLSLELPLSHLPLPIQADKDGDSSSVAAEQRAAACPAGPRSLLEQLPPRRLLQPTPAAPDSASLHPAQEPVPSPCPEGSLHSVKQSGHSAAILFPDKSRRARSFLVTQGSITSSSCHITRQSSSNLSLKLAQIPPFHPPGSRAGQIKAHFLRCSGAQKLTAAGRSWG